MRNITRLGCFLILLTCWLLPKRALAQLTPERLLINPASQARLWLSQNPPTSPYYNSVKYTANRTTSYWLTDENSVFTRDRALARHVQSGVTQGGLPVIVIYGIPYRDCNQSSRGGVRDDKYQAWIQEIAHQIGTHPAIVILEPDAIGLISNCRAIPGFSVDRRLSLLRNAILQLGTYPGRRSYLYLDVSFWTIENGSAQGYLRNIFSNVNIYNLVRGYALNVSNYRPSSEMQQRCSDISKLQYTTSKPCVIDVGRNGVALPNNGQYCNRDGARIGRTPTTRTGVSNIDAYLWIKNVGESDGNGPSCHTNDPAAGVFSARLARLLVEGF